jgi:ABC-2 type transport system permease protein
MIAKLRRVAAVARKEIWQLSRDRPTLGMIVGIPIIQLLLFGYAINQDVRHVPTAVLDRSSSGPSRKFVGELGATQTFDILYRLESEGQGLRLLGRGEIQALVVIPPDFARRIHRGRGAEVSVLADATDPTVARAVRASAAGLGQRLAGRTQPFGAAPGAAMRAPPENRARFSAAPDLIRTEPVRISVLPYYNAELRTTVFIVPALIGVILTMTMVFMTAIAIVRERERGTFEFLIATPVGRLELMVGKILPYLVIGHLQVALILATGGLVFDVPIRGSLVDLWLGALVFIAANLTLGLLISSAAASQFQAMQMAVFIFLPSILLSGFMFPFESMPRPAQWLGEVLPLTHFLRVVRGILLRGAPVMEFGRDLAAMGLFLLAALAVATRRFRKALD